MSFRNPQRSPTAKIAFLTTAQSEMPPPKLKYSLDGMEKKKLKKEKSKAKHFKEDLHLYLPT